MAVRLVYHDFLEPEAISPFDIVINDLVAHEPIWIACPYLTLRYLQDLIESSASWRLLTDVEAWLAGQSKHARAIQAFLQRHAPLVHDYRNLHAKIIAAPEKALVGSANLTEMGVTTNDEFSVLFEHEPEIDVLHRWFERRWQQTAAVDEAALARAIEQLLATPGTPLEHQPIRLPTRGPRIRSRLLKRPPATHPQAAADPPQQLDTTRPGTPRLRVCSKCGRTENEVKFYASRKITFCAEHFDEVNKLARKTPTRRQKINIANRAWQQQHPEAMQRAREKDKAKRLQASQMRREHIRQAGWLTLTEASAALGVSREMARQYAEKGRLGEIHTEADDARGRYVRVEAVEALRAARTSTRPTGEDARPADDP